MIMVSQIRLSLDADKKTAIEKAIKKSRIPRSNIVSVDISKASLDARKNQVHFVYSVAIYTDINEKKYAEKNRNKDITYIRDSDYKIENISVNSNEKRPVIVGFGPAGMFCGLVLAKAGLRPIILERGAAVDDRVKAVDNFWGKGVLSENTNVQFGEGGAGTFSDGKLTTRIKDPRCHFILKEFVASGAPKEVAYKAKPHIGTDILRSVVKNLRKKIEKLGGEIRFNSTVIDFSFENNKIQYIETKDEKIYADHVVLAVGHSARDIFENLYSKNISMEAKSFSVGVRVEHLQENIDKGLYKKHAGHKALPKGEYQFSYRDRSGRGVYTFCMCPGGFVVPSSSEFGGVVTNGMSRYKRDGINANSAIVVSVTPDDFGKNPMDGIYFQRKYENKAFEICGKNYKAPSQTYENFKKNVSGLSINRVNPSYSIGVTEANFNNVFPQYVVDMLHVGFGKFNLNLSGFSDGDTILTGVETRTSSPVRIIRNENNESISAKGLYPAGEGPGYAGGIMSAAVDGMKVAESIINSFL